MKTRIRGFIRSNELSDTMVAINKDFPSLRAAIRYCSDSYSTLGQTSIRRGLFYDDNYKQIMVEKSLAAKGTIAMLIVEGL